MECFNNDKVDTEDKAKKEKFSHFDGWNSSYFCQANFHNNGLKGKICTL